MPLLIAELPDLAWLGIGAVVLFLVAALGGSMFLREMRQLRTNVADELKREIESAKEAQPVSVQQPLIVTPHEKLVTLAQHEELKQRVDGCATSAQLSKVENALKEDLTKQAGARKKMHEEIAELQGDVKVLRSQNETQSLQLGKLDGKMDQVLMRLPRTSS